MLLSKEKLICRQLRNSDSLTDEQYQNIATLIYETDPYIYPALFASNIQPLKAAHMILPQLIESNTDAMFRKDNLYICEDNSGVCSLILWHKGPLVWNTISLLDTASSMGIELIEANVKAVRKSYVAEIYNTDDASIRNTLSIINVCVDVNKRGLGIGGFLLSSFICDHVNESMELCVLADNDNAVNLYKRFGFVITKQYSGFSLGNIKPDCFEMRKK